jgi:hypothetical protein
VIVNLLFLILSSKKEKRFISIMQSAVLRRAGAKGLRSCGCRVPRASLATLATFRPPTITNEPNVSINGDYIAQKQTKNCVDANMNPSLSNIMSRAASSERV